MDVASRLQKSKSMVSEDETSRLKRMLSTKIEKYNHLLVAKVKDTQMMFGFFIEASIIDVDQNLGGAGPQ